MRLVTVKELSKLLNVNEKTLYQWAGECVIPSIKMNGCLRFDMDDIEKWIKDCKKDSTSGYNPLTQARGPKRGGR